MGAKLDVPEFFEENNVESNKRLRKIIQDQAEIIQKQAKEIQHLQDEIARRPGID